MMAMRGYWVYMAIPSIVIVDGTLPCPTKINLAKGWNLVGPAGTIPMPLHPSAVVGYALTNGKYTIPRRLSPGNGYWIYMQKAVTNVNMQ